MVCPNKDAIAADFVAMIRERDPVTIIHPAAPAGTFFLTHASGWHGRRSDLSGRRVLYPSTQIACKNNKNEQRE